MSSTIFEVTLKGNTLYEMPDDVYGIVTNALQVSRVLYGRGGRSVSRVVALLPEYWRNQIKITPVQKEEPSFKVNGLEVSEVIIDECKRVRDMDPLERDEFMPTLRDLLLTKCTNETPDSHDNAPRPSNERHPADQSDRTGRVRG